MKKILILIFSLITSAAHAKSFVKVDITNYGNAFTQSQRDQIDGAARSLENQINQELPASDVDSFLKNSANASILANTGNNYYSPRDGILIGLIVGAAGKFSGGKSVTELGNMNTEDINGVGVGAGIMVAVSPSKFSDSENPYLSRMQFGISAMSGKLNISEADVTYSTFGLNATYRVISEQSLAYLVKWNGLDLHTGLKYSKTNLDFKKNLQVTGSPTTVDYSGVSATLTPSFDGVVLAGAEISTLSVPLEVSTSIELLKVFQFFGGVGMDISQGTSRGKGTATGPVVVQSDQPVLTGTITANVLADMDSEQSADTVSHRYFVGAALDFKYVSISAQMNKSLSNQNEGVTIGIFSSF